jgi:hypothetical protein
MPCLKGGKPVKSESHMIVPRSGAAQLQRDSAVTRATPSPWLCTSKAPLSTSEAEARSRSLAFSLSPHTLSSHVLCLCSLAALPNVSMMLQGALELVQDPNAGPAAGTQRPSGPRSGAGTRAKRGAVDAGGTEAAAQGAAGRQQQGEGQGAAAQEAGAVKKVGAKRRLAEAAGAPAAPGEAQKPPAKKVCSASTQASTRRVGSFVSARMARAGAENSIFFSFNL